MLKLDVLRAVHCTYSVRKPCTLPTQQIHCRNYGARSAWIMCDAPQQLQVERHESGAWAFPSYCTVHIRLDRHGSVAFDATLSFSALQAQTNGVADGAASLHAPPKFSSGRPCPALPCLLPTRRPRGGRGRVRPAPSRSFTSTCAALQDHRTHRLAAGIRRLAAGRKPSAEQQRSCRAGD